MIKLIIFVATAIFLSPTSAPETQEASFDVSLPIINEFTPQKDTRSYLVTFEKTPQTRDLAQKLGVSPEKISVNEKAKVATIEVSNAQTAQIETKLDNLKGAKVEDDEPIKAFLTPNDTHFSNQSARLSKIGAPSAWDITQGAGGTIIAIVDTGVNGTHEDLSGKVIAGHDYINNQAIASGADSDDHGHGTQVAGIAGAVGNNGKGVAGVDWQARIMPVKVLNSNGEGTTTDAVNGITYAADNGATIINMSFGRSTDSAALKSAVEYAASKGVLLVGAAGNEARGEVSYPAAYSDVIAVGALDTDDRRAGFSNYGAALDVVAPGTSLRTTTDSVSSYVAVSGTSGAAPIVSGALGLAKDMHSQFSASEIKNLVLEKADKLAAMNGENRTDEYGYGLLNIYKVLSSTGSYSAESAGWSSSDGSFTHPSIMAGGDAVNLTINLKNTGKTTWNQDIVHLATVSPRDRIPGFVRESTNGSASGWTSPNRVKMQESSVAPGQTATFSFWLKSLSDKTPGTYRERFELVADGVDWFSRELGIYWDITVLSAAQSYKAQPAGWSSSGGDFVHPTITSGGAGTNLVIRLKNTGKATWTQGNVNLGTISPYDRIPGFVRESGTSADSGWTSPNRVKMQESSVAPGQTATFSFWLKSLSDKTPGTYREYFAPVAEGVTWFSEDLGIYWDVTVR